MMNILLASDSLSKENKQGLVQKTPHPNDKMDAKEIAGQRKT
jgi:hypothetical protein